MIENSIGLHYLTVPFFKHDNTGKGGGGMKKGRIFLFIVSLILCFGQGEVFAFNNYGFETGDLSGWAYFTTWGPLNVVTSYSGSQGTLYTAPAGNYFLRISGSTNYYYKNFYNSVLTIPYSHLESGTVLEGWAAYDHRGELSDEDDAFVTIRTADIQDNLSGLVWSYDVHDTSPGADVPWMHWRFTVPQDGDYYVAYGVRSGAGTTALFDGGAIILPTHTVPEPATMLLFGTGLAGAFLRSRFNK